jgi:hypothetical protein
MNNNYRLAIYVDCVPLLQDYSNEESRESVVIAVPDLDIDNVKIYSTCLRRDGVFIGIFFVMPLGIGICLSVVIYFAWFRRRLKQSSLPRGMTKKIPMKTPSLLKQVEYILTLSMSRSGTAITTLSLDSSLE